MFNLPSIKMRWTEEILLDNLGKHNLKVQKVKKSYLLLTSMRQAALDELIMLQLSHCMGDGMCLNSYILLA